MCERGNDGESWHHRRVCEMWCSVEVYNLSHCSHTNSGVIIVCYWGIISTKSCILSQQMGGGGGGERALVGLITS